jgi:hypothetical protein
MGDGITQGSWRSGLKAIRKGTRLDAADLPRPTVSAGQESNWLYTPPGKEWFPWFRFYGPEKALFDQTWKLPDIEQVK